MRARVLGWSLELDVIYGLGNPFPGERRNGSASPDFRGCFFVPVDRIARQAQSEERMDSDDLLELCLG